MKERNRFDLKVVVFFHLSICPILTCNMNHLIVREEEVGKM